MNPTNPDAMPAQPADNTGFRGQLPDDLKNHDALSSLAGPEELAREYLAAREKLSGLPVPPESAAAYDLPVAEGLPFDPAMADGFRQAAFEAGLTQAQVSALTGWHNQTAQARLDEAGRLAGRTEETLRSEWGSDYEPNLDLARRALKAVGDPELIRTLDESGLSNQLMVVRLFHRIGRAIREDALADSGSSAPGNRSAAQTLYPELSR